ncbi:MAG: phage tail tape measure protein, partial [Methanosarcinales archaeon]|nr:phage tail tape measure protein [Methanosarcinales archaeon]
MCIRDRFAGWEKAGVTTEIAFSGMKLAIGKWGKAGKDSTVEFEKTLKAIKGAPDITAATGMAIEIFGQRAGADLADAIQGGRFEIGDYVTALENAGGTVESTYAGITDGTDDAKVAFNQIKVSASELGSVIVATLTPILKSLGEKIKEVGAWFSGLSPEMKKTVLMIAGIAAA